MFTVTSLSYYEILSVYLTLQVPCVAVVENMCYFDGDDKRYFPYGKGSGAQVAPHDISRFYSRYRLCHVEII